MSNDGGGNSRAEGRNCASVYCLRTRCTSGSPVDSCSNSRSGPAMKSSRAFISSAAVEYSIDSSRRTATRAPCSSSVLRRSYGLCSAAMISRLRRWK